MHNCFLLLGGNVGEKKKTMESALKTIGSNIGALIKKSSFYHSEPWGFRSDDSFLNVVVLVKTEKLPHEILELILEIESTFGRKRSGSIGYESRTLDIDILFYDKLIVETENLCIPHPRLHQRRFTLEPLNEIEPDFVHPLIGKNIAELLKICPDQSPVMKEPNLKTEKPAFTL